MWSGQDWDQLKARIASIPGCEGMVFAGRRREDVVGYDGEDDGGG